MASASHTAHQLLDQGVYSLAEAARLTSMPAGTIRRWVLGYSWGASRDHRSGPVVAASIAPIDGNVAVTFNDLVELLFVSRFVQHGVSLGVVKKAASAANEMFGEARYGFTLRQFETDGRRVFARFMDEGDEHMIDLARNQHVFQEAFAPLLHQLDYGERYATRWWPLGKNEPVVCDPSIAFGRPVVDRFGISTSTLAASADAWGSAEEVASWFDVPLSTVEAAVRFEARAA